MVRNRRSIRTGFRARGGGRRRCRRRPSVSARGAARGRPPRRSWPSAVERPGVASRVAETRADAAAVIGVLGPQWRTTSSQSPGAFGRRGTGGAGVPLSSPIAPAQVRRSPKPLRRSVRPAGEPTQAARARPWTPAWCWCCDGKSDARNRRPTPYPMPYLPPRLWRSNGVQRREGVAGAASARRRATTGEDSFSMSRYRHAKQPGELPRPGHPLHRSPCHDLRWGPRGKARTRWATSKLS